MSYNVHKMSLVQRRRWVIGELVRPLPSVGSEAAGQSGQVEGSQAPNLAAAEPAEPGVLGGGPERK